MPITAHARISLLCLIDIDIFLYAGFQVPIKQKSRDKNLGKVVIVGLFQLQNSLQ